MSVLVTGGAGYIGSHMVLELLDAGEKVVVLDNLSTGFRWAVDKRATFVEGDTGNEEFVTALMRAHKIEAVIHFAAKIVVPDSVSDPLGYYLNNTVNTRAMAASAVKAGVKHFIFSSTAAVYGTPDSATVAESAPVNPESPYGMSKLMSEIMLRDAAKAHDFSVVVLRYFNVAGADPKGRTGQSTPHATHLIKVAVQTALGLRDGMQVFGTDWDTPDGTCIRDYIHVTDLARAHLAALNYLRAGGESATFNCGYGTGYSVNQVIDVVKQVTKTDFPVTYAPRRAGDAQAVVADPSLIKQTLGWVPEHADLTGIISAAYKWEKMLGQKMHAM